MKPNISISIVLYNTPREEIEALLSSLIPFGGCSKIIIVDNANGKYRFLREMSSKIIYLNPEKNLGFGAGHNLAIREAWKGEDDYHLILNPDVEFDSVILEELVQSLDLHTDVGLVAPKILYPNGNLQCSFKLLPTPVNLFVRRFLGPLGVKIKQRYTLDFFDGKTIQNMPGLSGCFLLIKHSVLKQVGLFDSRYFMYLEDVDFIRRVHEKYKTIYYPHVFIYHHHGQGSYKNIKLLCYHMMSAIRYFNKWGWFFDKTRKKVNAETLKRLMKSS